MLNTYLFVNKKNKKDQQYLLLLQIVFFNWSSSHHLRRTPHKKCTQEPEYRVLVGLFLGNFPISVHVPPRLKFDMFFLQDFLIFLHQTVKNVCKIETIKLITFHSIYQSLYNHEHFNMEIFCDPSNFRGVAIFPGILFHCGRHSYERRRRSQLSLQKDYFRNKCSRYFTVVVLGCWTICCSVHNTARTMGNRKLWKLPSLWFLKQYWRNSNSFVYVYLLSTHHAQDKKEWSQRKI